LRGGGDVLQLLDSAMLSELAVRVRRLDGWAEDGVQDALLDLVTRVRKGEGIGRTERDDVREWIVRGTWYAAFKQMRKWRVRLSEPLSDDSLADPDPGPEASVQRAEEASAARSEVARLLAGRCLGSRDRSLILALFLEEQSPDEVARRRGCDVGAVYVARHRALRRLRRVASRRAAPARDRDRDR